MPPPTCLALVWATLNRDDGKHARTVAGDETLADRRGFLADAGEDLSTSVHPLTLARSRVVEPIVLLSQDDGDACEAAALQLHTESARPPLEEAMATVSCGSVSGAGQGSVRCLLSPSRTRTSPPFRRWMHEFRRRHIAIACARDNPARVEVEVIRGMASGRHEGRA